jgi:hypothetical protein
MNMRSIFFSAGIGILFSLVSCTIGPNARDGATYAMNAGNAGPSLAISIERGSAWMNPKKIGVIKVKITPQIALWIQDTAGVFVENIFVTRCFGKQAWRMMKLPPDSCGRDMCMPYWLNKLRASGGKAPTRNAPLPDAVTGATPPGGFTVTTKLKTALRAFDVCMELNKSFDCNEQYTNKTKPNPFNGQPAIVYKARVNLDDTAAASVAFVYAGHAGSVGSDAALYENKDGITTALDMIKQGKVEWSK